MGLMKLKYKVSKVFLFNLKDNEYILHILCSARIHISFTWIVHFKSLLKVTSRCLCVETDFRWLPENVRGFGGSEFGLKERTMSQVFSALNITCHCLDQESMRHKSLFNAKLQVWILLENLQKRLSSAYKLKVDSKLYLMSLIKIKYSRGPRTDPWGTPACKPP